MAFKTQRNFTRVGRPAAAVKAWLIGSSVAEARRAALRPTREAKPSSQPGAYGLLVGFNRW